jgi:hypothetical protein
MAKRTLKHGKRGSRKMGGRKAKKGARKTHRKRGGAGDLPPKAIDWVQGFTSAKKAKGLFTRQLVYTFTWEPTTSATGVLTLDSSKSEFIGNVVSSLASVAGKGLTARYYDLLKNTVGLDAAESFKSAMAAKAGFYGAKALSKVVFNAENDKVTKVTLYINNDPVDLTFTQSDGTFALVKAKFEKANGAGELEPAPPSPEVTGPAPPLALAGPGMGNSL